MYSFVPDHLLRRLLSHPHPDVRRKARRSILLSSIRRSRRRLYVPKIQLPSDLAFGAAAAAPTVKRAVYTANGAETDPGSLIRKEGDSPVQDQVVNAAYDDAGVVFDFYWHAFQRNSIDDAGMQINSTVHYGTDYDNAFWGNDWMDYGDGDGQVFQNFVSVIDIPGHEMSHGVTQYTSNLAYHDQPGALNESFSDCMGSCVKQYKLGQTADKADWLIGQGIFYPSIQGRALRDMRNPGTAYNDPNLGRDMQPANMSGYIQTTEDEGGVHLNSGIPNKAFADACVAVGGNSWEHVGLVWYKTQFKVPSECDFQTWANTTVELAGQIFPGTDVVAKAITAAWAGVGVTVGAASPSTPPAPPAAGISPARFSRLLGMVQMLILRFGAGALPYIEQLVSQLPLSQVQLATLQNFVSSLLSMVGAAGGLVGSRVGSVASLPEMDREALEAMVGHLTAA